MRGPGYCLVTDLLVAAGRTREQASAAVARFEWATTACARAQTTARHRQDVADRALGVLTTEVGDRAHGVVILK